MATPLQRNSDGTLKRGGGKLQRGEDCCPCGGSCCPDGLPVSYVVTGHVKVTLFYTATDCTGPSTVVAEGDFTETITLTFTCIYVNTSQTRIRLEPILDTGVCKWLMTLSYLAFVSPPCTMTITIVSTGSPVGSYGDTSCCEVDVGAGTSYLVEFTGVTISP